MTVLQIMHIISFYFLDHFNKKKKKNYSAESGFNSERRNKTLIRSKVICRYSLNAAY